MSNDEWLKDQCNRYLNGFCSTSSCLKRGGLVADDPRGYEAATCHAHEVLQELEVLRELYGARAVAVHYMTHIHVSNGIDDQCRVCGRDLRDKIHIRV